MQTPRTTTTRKDAADDRLPASSAAHRIDQLRDTAAAVIVAMANPWGKPESPEQTAAIESVTVPDFPTALYQAAFAFVIGERENGAAAIRRGQLTDHLAAEGFVDEEIGVVEGWFAETYTNVNVVRDVAALKDAAHKMRLADLHHRAMLAAQNGVHLADAIAEAQSIADTANAISSVGELRPLSVGTMIDKYPHLRPVLIDGLIRLGEVINLIAAPKTGKSWMVLLIAFCVALGLRLWDTFACTPCRVLIIDNELHPETIAHRIAKVAAAMGLRPSEYADRIDVLHLRGRLMDLRGLRRYMSRIKRGYYGLIVIDAWYRMLPEDKRENGNEDQTFAYNLLDECAEITGSAILVVHHASKGNQSGKDVTDVGAGGGAMSRATDDHIILRQHEDDGHLVLEAAPRSFPPLVPVGLRWEFPLWVLDEALDTSALKGKRTRGEERQQGHDAEAIDTLRAAMVEGPITVSKARKLLVCGKPRAERVLFLMVRDGIAEAVETTVSGNQTEEYHLVD